jgi:hypothetical protein
MTSSCATPRSLRQRRVARRRHPANRWRQTAHKPRRSSFSLSDFIVQIADYDRVRGLGQGSFGAVYCARKRGTDQLVAIKTLSANIAATDDQRSLIREIESLARKPPGAAAARRVHAEVLRRGRLPCDPD